MSGKGSKRRAGKPGAYARGYDAINWSKGRKPAAPRKVSATATLYRDHTTPVEWVIPTLEDILGPSSYKPVRFTEDTK